MARNTGSKKSRQSFKPLWIVVGVVAVGALVTAVIRSGSGTKTVPLKEGIVLGEQRFAPGDASQGGHGDTINGITCTTQEQLAVHNHAHLSLFINGKQTAVPPGVGIAQPATQGPAKGQACIYWLHTHDGSGIIHIEAPVNKTFTLGDFFAIWGVPLSANNLAGTEGPVTANVDGKPWTGDLGSIPITPHANITVQVGTPVATPPQYQLPQGM